MTTPTQPEVSELIPVEVYDDDTPLEEDEVEIPWLQTEEEMREFFRNRRVHNEK